MACINFEIYNHSSYHIYIHPFPYSPSSSFASWKLPSHHLAFTTVFAMSMYYLLWIGFLRSLNITNLVYLKVIWTLNQRQDILLIEMLWFYFSKLTLTTTNSLLKWKYFIIIYLKNFLAKLIWSTWIMKHVSW